MTATFADGTTERVALIYGANIRGIEDRLSATDATFARAFLIGSKR